MKNLTLFLPLGLLLLFACKKEKIVSIDSPCIQEKIAAFKTIPDTKSVIRITAPQGRFYRFSRSQGLSDEILHENCEVVCVIDTECGMTSISCALSDLFEHPSEVIWEK